MMFHHDDEKRWDQAGPHAGVFPEHHPSGYDDHDVTTQGSHDDDDDEEAGSTAPPSMRRQGTARASEDLRRTASNVLSTIASRITTRGWPEPPPPPDGGVKAWTQVACVRLTVKLSTPRNSIYQGSSELKTTCLGFCTSCARVVPVDGDCQIANLDAGMVCQGTLLKLPH